MYLAAWPPPPSSPASPSSALGTASLGRTGGHDHPPRRRRRPGCSSSPSGRPCALAALGLAILARPPAQAPHPADQAGQRRRQPVRRPPRMGAPRAAQDSPRTTRPTSTPGKSRPPASGHPVITEPGILRRAARGRVPRPGPALSSTGARHMLPPSCPALFEYERDAPGVQGRVRLRLGRAQARPRHRPEDRDHRARRTGGPRTPRNEEGRPRQPDSCRSCGRTAPRRGDGRRDPGPPHRRAAVRPAVRREGRAVASSGGTPSSASGAVPPRLACPPARPPAAARSSPTTRRSTSPTWSPSSRRSPTTATTSRTPSTPTAPARRSGRRPAVHLRLPGKTPPYLITIVQLEPEAEADRPRAQPQGHGAVPRLHRPPASGRPTPTKSNTSRCRRGRAAEGMTS